MIGKDGRGYVPMGLLDTIARAREDLNRTHGFDFGSAQMLEETIRLVLDHAIGQFKGALDLAPEDAGRIMHQQWVATKRAQGFHHPAEPCPHYGEFEGVSSAARCVAHCSHRHPDLIEWDLLPDGQKEINRSAFRALLAEVKKRLGI